MKKPTAQRCEHCQQLMPSCQDSSENIAGAAHNDSVDTSDEGAVISDLGPEIKSGVPVEKKKVKMKAISTMLAGKLKNKE